MESVLLLLVRIGIILVLLMPFVVKADVFYPFVTGKALYARSLIEIVFVLWIVLAIRYSRYRPRFSWVTLTLALYVAIGFLAGLTGVSITLSLWSNYERMQGMFDMVHWLAFVVILASVFHTMIHWRTILGLNLAVSLAISVVGLAQNYGKTLLPYLWHLSDTGRVDATLGNPTFMAAFLLVNIFVAIALLSNSFNLTVTAHHQILRGVAGGRRGQRDQLGYRFVYVRRWLWRAFLVSTAGVDLSVLLLTGTRGAFVGLVAGAVIGIFAYMRWGARPALKRAVWVILVLVVLLGGASVAIKDTAIADRVVSSNIMFERLRMLPGENWSVSSRLVSAKVGLKAFLHRPILGWGPENYSVAFDRYATQDYFSRSNKYNDQAHNKIVEELATKGILGLVGYLFLWGVMFRVLFLMIRRGPRDELLFFGIGMALVAYFVQNLFLFDTPAPLLQFMLLVGLVASVEIHMIDGNVLPCGPSVRRKFQATLFRKIDSPITDMSIRITRAIYLPVEWFGNYIRAIGVKPFNAFVATLVCILLVILGFTLYRANYMSYKAAQSIVAVMQDPDLSRFPWSARIRVAGNSFAMFPPLANQPRALFFAVVGGNYRTLNQGEVHDVLELADREGAKALAQEPQSIRVRLGLARLYREARFLDMAFLDQARVLLDEAKELAPYRPQVLDLLKAQDRIEAEIEQP